MGGTVQVRREGHAVIIDAGQSFLALGDDVVGLHAVDVHREHLAEPGAQRQHLESAAVGESRARPVHECAQPACLFDDVGAGLQVQVVRVGQNSLCAKLFHGFRHDSLHGGLGADRDEGRGVDVAVRCSDDTGAPEPSGKLRFDAERRLCHDVYSTNRRPRPERSP